MSRFPVTVLLLAPLLAVAAPVPKDPDAKFKKLFGSGHTPDKKGELKFADGPLTVAFPEEDWVGDEFRPLKCPHTALELKGDFEITVAVRTTGPATPPDHRKQCVLGGGLVVWDAADAEAKPIFLRRHFAERGGGRRGGPNPWFEEVEAHYPGEVLGGEREDADPTTTLHLRMKRADKTVTFATSTDGKTWGEAGKRETDLPATASVGVWGYNCTGVAGDVVFEGFTVTRPK